MLIPFLLTAAVTAPPADGPLVTVLPNGEALVEETIAVQPRGGRVDLPRPETLRPESVVATAGEDGTPLTVFFDPPVSGLHELLTRCVGETVRILPAGPQAEASGLPQAGTLVAPGDPALVRLDTGEVVPVRAERLACRDDGDARTRLGVLVPEKAAGPLRLRWAATGFGWQVRHRLDLDAEGGSGRLISTTVVALPPGTSFTGARLRLAEGDVPRVAGPQPGRAPRMMKMEMAAAPAPDEDAMAAQSTSFDLVLFDVPGRWELTGPGRITLPLRPAAAVKPEDVLRLDLHRWSGPSPEFEPLFPQRRLRFRVEGTAPLPAGVFDVGTRRADGSWLPLGEAPTARVASGKTAEVRLGEVRDVTIAYRTADLAELRDAKYLREAAFEVQVENHRDRPAIVELEHHLGSYVLIDSSVPPHAKTGTSLVFRRTLAPGAKETLRWRAKVDPRPRMS